MVPSVKQLFGDLPEQQVPQAPGRGTPGCGSRSGISWAGMRRHLMIWWRAIIQCGPCGGLSRGLICARCTMR